MVGWLKINIDGAFDQFTHCGGVGIVVRDSEGSVLEGFCKKINHVYSPDIVEAEAGRMACEFACFHHLSPVVFESDCQKLVRDSTIGKDDEDHSNFGMVLADIRSSLSLLPSSFFSHVYRESNVMAHSVARFALSNNMSCSWYGVAPLELSDLLVTNCNI